MSQNHGAVLRKGGWAVVLWAVMFQAGAALGGSAPSVRMIADFNTGIRNRLGGYHNRYQAGPSRATTLLSEAAHRGSAGRSLRVDALRKEGGYCGVWIHFFDFHSPRSRFLDARGYPFLSFRVKGAVGGETFAVKLADAAWVKREDGLRVGHVEDFIGGRVSTNWQEVLVPLDRARGLDLAKLGGLTLDFDVPGAYTVYIDDVCLKQTSTAKVPITVKSAALTKRSHRRAMWVWHTDALLDDEKAAAEFFSFCSENNISLIWMQLPLAYHPDVAPGPPRPTPKDFTVEILKAASLRRFLGRAHRAGLKVHALDGYPEYAQKEYHYIPAATVRALAAFNAAAPKEARFDGIHYDNEPYLLLGWHDPQRRERILREFLELNNRLEREARAAGLAYGVDIPFWWHEADERTGRPAGLVEYDGKSLPADFHCIQMLDNVGVMDYRDIADGADGIVAHAEPLLEYGDRAGRAKIYIGVETFAYAPTRVWFALGLPREEFRRALQGRGSRTAFLSRLEGFRLQVFDDGSNVHVGIQIPADARPQELRRMRGVMHKLASQFGLGVPPASKETIAKVYATAAAAIGVSPEWKDFQRRAIPGGETAAAAAPGFVATRMMLPKITFADDDYGYMTRQLRSAEALLAGHESYAGLAVHFYRTFRRLAEKGK